MLLVVEKGIRGRICHSIYRRRVMIKIMNRHDFSIRLGIIWGYAPPRQGNRSSTTMS